MRMEELYYLTGLQAEIICRLHSVCEEVDFGQAAPYMERLMDRRTAAEAYKELKTFLAEDVDNMKMLYCQLECARRAFEQYRQKGITEKIYADTMKCFQDFWMSADRKTGECFSTGAGGLTVRSVWDFFGSELWSMNLTSMRRKASLRFIYLQMRICHWRQ